MVVSENTIIYICCPAAHSSGGPEALHQLQYYMTKLGYNAYMAYYGIKPGKENTPERYKKYCSKTVLISEIEDEENNIIIIPECKTKLSYRFKNAKKCIWWLSVGFFDGNISFKSIIRQILSSIRHLSLEGLKNSIANLRYKCKKNKFKEISAHFVGSKYAYEFLDKKGISNKEYLIEPISMEFLDAGMFLENGNRERSDVILYNPAKPSKIQKSIMKDKSLHFVPLKGFSVE